jgi:hypothetical protein
MQRIDRFSLESHAGPYEKWPLRTRLLIDGTPSATSIPGYSLLHQFSLLDGYLLITDDDCPFEEATHFILLDPALRLRSRRTLSVPYGSFLLQGFEWLNDSEAIATFYQDDAWQLTIRAWGIPFLRPRLQLRRVTQ